MKRRSVDPDDDLRYRVPIGELGPIVTAAIFALLFIAVSIWLVFKPNIIGSLVPHAKPAPAGEVTVSVPEPAKK